MIFKKCSKFLFSFLTLLLLNLPVLAHAAVSDIDKLMADTAVPFITNNQIPGTAIAIYYNGQDYYFNYGVSDKRKNTPVTKNTIFELASITKIFVTTLLAIEVNEGRIHLSDPVVEYIPRLTKTKGLPINKVKIVDLATHTSSFPRQMEQFGVKKGDINGFLNSLKTWNPKVPVGTQYEYSNIGFGFLGRIVVRASGKTLPNLLNQYITQPLEMHNTYFTVPLNKKFLEAQGYTPNKMPATYYVPANFLGGGALRSSSADLLKFMKANLGVRTAISSDQLLSAMQFAQRAQFVVRPNFAMGLGWQRVKRGQELLITKNGGNQGFGTFIGFSPARKLGVVVLTNQSKSNAALLGNQILKRLLAL